MKASKNGDVRDYHRDVLREMARTTCYKVVKVDRSVGCGLLYK